LAAAKFVAIPVPSPEGESIHFQTGFPGTAVPGFPMLPLKRLECFDPVRFNHDRRPTTFSS
jgi:hypothetical protein